MSFAEPARRLQFLRLFATEVSACHEDACGRGLHEPVIFLVDLDDPVGQRLAQHYELHDPVSLIALPPEEALGWLGGEQAPLELLQALQTEVPMVIVVLLLWNAVSVHSIPLG